MDENLRVQIDSNLAHLDALIRRGRRICDSLVANPADKSAVVANRAWQQDVGLLVHQLSGGSKAHWLSRSFSEAFLMRDPSGQAIEAVEPGEIAVRLLGVLSQAALSLTQMREGEGASNPSVAPPPRRFEFVHNAELRPILEQAYPNARRAVEEGNFGMALVACCGILETIVTDALEHANLAGLSADPAALGKITDWPFETRLATAESVGLISGGWARLPEMARQYRDFTDAADILNAQVSERDARRAMQVLHVVMKDLDPGR